MLRHLGLLVVYGSTGALAMAVLVFVLYVNSKPDLERWHRAELEAEFTEDSELVDLEDYIELEQELFEELDRKLLARTGKATTHELNRFKAGSTSSPARWPRDWNRSFEFTQADPEAVVLLLHGLSDSPYSLRVPALALHATGAHVFGLRIPGHGTAPSALVRTTWQDMAAAVDLAADDLDRRFPDKPLYLVGYSNGAALALLQTLRAIEEPDQRIPDRIVLISPEIAVASAAALAVWQARLGRWLGLDKLAWNDVQPEYDPFKYGSFAVAAGDLAHRLTREVQARITRLASSGALEAMPPVLAFSSLVDATVQAPELVSRLFNPLPPGEHELVLFDINRQAGMSSLLKWRADRWAAAVDRSIDGQYRLTVVTNEHPNTLYVEARDYDVDGVTDVRSLGLAWPRDVYSLSHVALGFPSDDPLYGGQPDDTGPGLHLGTIQLKGERGVLQISDSAMLRQRWNPFFPYLQERLLTFLGLVDP